VLKNLESAEKSWYSRDCQLTAGVAGGVPRIRGLVSKTAGENQWFSQQWSGGCRTLKYKRFRSGRSPLLCHELCVHLGKSWVCVYMCVPEVYWTAKANAWQAKPRRIHLLTSVTATSPVQLGANDQIERKGFAELVHVIMHC